MCIRDRYSFIGRVISDNKNHFVLSKAYKPIPSYRNTRFQMTPNFNTKYTHTRIYLYERATSILVYTQIVLI